MEKESIKRIILDNQEILISRGFIPRELQLPYSDMRKLQKIFAVIGPRRSGKTYFLRQIYDELEISRNQVVFLDFSEIVLADFKTEDFTLLLSAFIELYPEDEPVFFFDEIQEVGNYEAGLKYLLNRNNLIFITGSSSKMMIDDLSSSLRGKVLNYFLLPLSFKEYLMFKESEIPVRETLSTRQAAQLYLLQQDYLNWGGFPEVVLSDNDDLKSNLLASYIDTMLLRDIIERYSVKNVHLVNLLFWKITRSFTKEISINKWYNDFKSMGLRVSNDTLYLYLNYFEDTFFFFFINSYKKGPTSRKKAYLVDNGIYNHARGLENDYGKNLENQVFIDLKRRNEAEVHYFKDSGCETDFITENLVLQVCYKLADENRHREVDGLKSAMSVRPGIPAVIVSVEENEISSSIPEVELYWKWSLRIPLQQ